MTRRSHWIGRPVARNVLGGGSRRRILRGACRSRRTLPASGSRGGDSDRTRDNKQFAAGYGQDIRDGGMSASRDAPAGTGAPQLTTRVSPPEGLFAVSAAGGGRSRGDPARLRAGGRVMTSCRLACAVRSGCRLGHVLTAPPSARSLYGRGRPAGGRACQADLASPAGWSSASAIRSACATPRGRPARAHIA